jgi:hypothetical protein
MGLAKDIAAVEQLKAVTSRRVLNFIDASWIDPFRIEPRSPVVTVSGEQHY